MAQQSMGNRGLGQAHPVSYSPTAPESVDINDQTPSDSQPPGVDDEMPQSLEEALLGE